MSEEYLDVVDLHDRVVGKVSITDIYAQRLPHRIVHVFVLHPQTGAVYLQRRAPTDDYLPGHLSTSAGGHMLTGETYEQAAQRELAEELGLTTQVELLRTGIFEPETFPRHIGLFITWAAEGIRFADGEVDGGQFWSLDEAAAVIAKNDKIHPQLTSTFAWLCELRHDWGQKVGLSTPSI